MGDAEEVEDEADHLATEWGFEEEIKELRKLDREMV